MKKLYFLLFSFLIMSVSFGQTTVMQESFETDGNGSRYSTSVPEFTDGTGGDFFTRTDGTTTTVPSYYQVAGQDGSYYFAVMDTDGDNPGLTTLMMNFNNVDISTYTDLTFIIGVAEDDDGTNQDWDANTNVLIEINIDGGGYAPILQFSGGGATNTEPGLDTDFNGIADGTALSSSFQEFTASIGTGTSADIRITFNNLDAGDEDIAIDNIRIIDGYVATPTLVLTDSEPSGSTITTYPEDAATATIDFKTTNFTVAIPSAGDGYIKWNVKDTGDNIIDSGDIFTTDGTETPVNGLVAGNTYVLFAELVNNSGNPISPAVQYTLTLIVANYNVVADIAALRAHVTTNGVGEYYEITGGVLVTHTDGFNNRQWVQDNNISGIMITEQDSDSDITTYNIGDVVLGLKGRVEESNGVLRFLPTIDSGTVGSSGNAVTPQLVTIPDFNTNYSDYESELIELEDVTFDDGDGVATFSTGTNYDVSSNAGANIVVMRTDYFGADYIGQIIPSNELPSLIAIAGNFNSTAQIYVRSLADFTLSSNEVILETFNIYPNPTNKGYVNISSRFSSKMNVSVYDVLGKQVIKKSVLNDRLDVSSLKAGVYIIKITQGKAVSTKKLVIE